MTVVTLLQHQCLLSGNDVTHVYSDGLDNVRPMLNTKKTCSPFANRDAVAIQSTVWVPMSSVNNDVLRPGVNPALH